MIYKSKAELINGFCLFQYKLGGEYMGKIILAILVALETIVEEVFKED